MSIDINKLVDILKGTDLSTFKNNGEIKDVKDSLVFNLEDGEYTVNDELMTKEGFIETLSGGG